MKPIIAIIAALFITVSAQANILPNQQLCKIYSQKVSDYKSNKRLDNYYKKTLETYKSRKNSYCK